MKRRLVTEKDGWLLERKSFDWQPPKKWGPQSYSHNELNNCTSKDWTICSFQGLPRGGGTTQEQWVLILNLCWQSRENRVEEKVGGAKKGLLHTWLFPIQIRGIPKIIWRGIKGEFLLSNVDIWTYNYVYFMATEKQQEAQVTPCFQNELSICPGLVTLSVFSGTAKQWHWVAGSPVLRWGCGWARMLLNWGAVHVLSTSGVFTGTSPHLKPTPFYKILEAFYKFPVMYHAKN